MKRLVVAGLVRYEDELYRGQMLESDAAKKYLDEHPEVGMVEVQEHAGWWMRYVRYTGSEAQAVPQDGSGRLDGVACVGSANDQAVFPEWVYEWWRNTTVEYGGPTVVQYSDGTQKPLA